MKPKQKILRLICSGYLLLFLVFGFVSTANAAILPDPIKSSDVGTLPQYNRGVDTSIRDYLCVPSEDASGTDLYDCIGRVYRFGVAFGAIALVFFVVIAGYTYITGGETAKGKAKHMIINSLTGLGLILGSFVLLRFINPSLVEFKPIQPPIFTASLPLCKDVGLGEKCILSTGQVNNPPGGGGGKCSPASDSSPASIANLTNSCFGRYGADVVRQASIVAQRESGGDPSIHVGANACPNNGNTRCTGGEYPVWGLYQINITVHKVAGLNCPAAFTRGWACSNTCTVTNKALYNQCVAAAVNATNNINAACAISDASVAAGNARFAPWGNSGNEHGNKCGF